MNTKRYAYHCQRCGYDWYSTKKRPMFCANKKCHSPYWDRPRTKAVKAKR